MFFPIGNHSHFRFGLNKMKITENSFLHITCSWVQHSMSTKGRDEKEFIVFLTGDRIKYLSSVGLEHRIKGRVVGNWGLALGFQVIVLIFLR